MSEQMIRVGKQTVYFESSEHMCDVPDNHVDLIVTSPPYWNLKNYGKKKNQTGSSTYESYLESLDRTWAECYRVAREGAIFILNVNSRRNNGVFYPIAFDIQSRMKLWTLWDVLIWYIPNALPQPNHYMERLFDNKFEYLLVFLKGKPDQYKFHKPRVPQKYIKADPRDGKKNKNGRCIGNIIRIPAYRPPNVKELGYHEAAYPEELVSLMITSYTDEGDVVLDPFLGSGTTLKVCQIMNRQGIGYELNEGYQDLITERINEPWVVPDWRKVDLIHSTTMETGMKEPRKIQFSKSNKTQIELL